MSDEFHLRPIFAVSDTASSIAFYCDRLGFEPGWVHPEEDPIIAQVGRNGLDLILDSSSSIPRPSTPSVITMSLHESTELFALCAEFRLRGLTPIAEPVEVRWQPGIFQFEVRDPDGNVLVFWGDGPESDPASDPGAVS